MLTHRTPPTQPESGFRSPYFLAWISQFQESMYVYCIYAAQSLILGKGIQTLQQCALIILSYSMQMLWLYWWGFTRQTMEIIRPLTSTHTRSDSLGLKALHFYVFSSKSSGR